MCGVYTLAHTSAHTHTFWAGRESPNQLRDTAKRRTGPSITTTTAAAASINAISNGSGTTLCDKFMHIQTDERARAHAHAQVNSRMNGGDG